jgi:outer membrane lipoprotein-sorting protein
MNRLITLLTAALLGFEAVSAQTADEILNKYFEGIGGIEKVKAMKSIKMNGTLVMQQGEFEITMYKKAPDKIKIVMDIMGQEIIPQAYDGDTAWMVNPFTGSSGPQVMPEEQTKQLKEEAAFEDQFINYQEKGYKVYYEGTADVDGITCHMIKLAKADPVTGEESSSEYYFDTDTYLQLMIKQSSPQAMGQEILIYLSDYQDIGNGILMPFVIDTHFQGQSVQKLNLKSIQADVDVPDDFFRFPHAVSDTTAE